MVDGEGAALAAIERNTAALRYQDRVRVVRGRLPQALSRLAGSSFDLIFCDPPYGAVDAVALVAALLQARLVAPGATLVWEDGIDHAPALDALATSVHHRVHGDTVMTVWRLSDDAPH
jgi:16S rRNA (guanine966-N2)-methyltransferase